MTDTNPISLTGQRVIVTLTDKLALEVRDPDGALLWASSPDPVPTITVTPATANADEKTGQCDFALHLAMNQQVRPFSTASYSGHQLTLNGFPGTDVTLALALAIDAGTDELLIQVEQTDGQDTVVEVRHLYRFDKPPAAGGYMVLPHGSGYLIHADCPDELPGRGPRGGLIGHRWSAWSTAAMGCAPSWKPGGSRCRGRPPAWSALDLGFSLAEQPRQTGLSAPILPAVR